MRQYITLLVMLLASITAYSQTYCYKCTESIQNGVRTKHNPTYTYITFQNNMNSFYISDADGYSKTSSPMVYKLVSSNNNKYKYVLYGPLGPAGDYYTFNSDFSRYNGTNQYLPGLVNVGVQVDGPEAEDEEFY